MHAEKRGALWAAREPGDPVAARGRKVAGRRENAMSDKSLAHGSGESYSGVVPAKQPNKSEPSPAEVVEGRPLTKENTPESNPRRTPSRGSGTSGLERVREAAKQDGKLKFTALLHHVSIDLLRESYYSLKKKAAPVGRICKRPGGTFKRPPWKNPSQSLSSTTVAKNLNLEI